MIELHTHTTYSDGILTPQQLVDRAAIAGVQALAITDHDTLHGWDEAIAAAKQYQLEIVPGVELSTVHNGRSLHNLFRGGKVEDVLPELLAAGLMGLEVYHPHHGNNKVNRLKQLCQEHNLLMTGGTDYHGYDLEHPENERWQLNQLKLPLSLLESLQQLAR
ncbi:MAG: PHP domain-containing protein [Pleurocapsa sp. SU_5_0]|nr:PHP domain-containing protein [Pleurocapsa sp. SU_5_0]